MLTEPTSEDVPKDVFFFLSLPFAAQPTHPLCYGEPDKLDSVCLPVHPVCVCVLARDKGSKEVHCECTLGSFLCVT